jgi:nucleoside-diphosphate-sugar epimerase
VPSLRRLGQLVHCPHGYLSDLEAGSKRPSDERDGLLHGGCLGDDILTSTWFADASRACTPQRWPVKVVNVLERLPAQRDHVRVRLLVLGGSWFLGKALVDGAISRGWKVTTFSRGRSPLRDEVQAFHGNREDRQDLARLAKHGPWDVVLDVAGAVPAVVRDAVQALRRQAVRYVLISTISVYRDWPHATVDEQSPLWDGDPDLDPGTRAWDSEAYGPLKVGCELAARRGFGESLLLVRPTVILGPYEYVGRLPWWLRRIASGGRVLAPGPSDRAIQPIDVRDLAAFTLGMIDRETTGVYNAAAPVGRDTFADLLASCRRATGSSARLIWVDESWLAVRGVIEWTELPLWRTLPTAWTMDTSRAFAAGLTCRPLRNTVYDTWEWLRSGGQSVQHERFVEHGIDPRLEEQLLAAWEGRQPG